LRRNDREIVDRAEMESILRASPVCRLGMADGNEPYVVPVCFGYEDGSFFVHSATEGEKIDILRRSPRVCIEVDLTAGPIRNENPCAWEMRYKCVICRGTARFLEHREEKKHALNIILEHYGSSADGFSDQALAKICVIRIDVDQMTGKQHG